MTASLQELLDCRISSWYAQFKRVTFKTVILPLQQPVLDWLVSDGLHLPADSQAFARRGAQDEYATEDDYREWSSEEEEEEEAAAPPPELAELRRQMEAAIQALGGCVVPKLTWSVPKDAVWMSPSASLACSNADEVLLLLCSSDRVAHDVCHAARDAAAAAPNGSHDSSSGGGSEASSSGGEAASGGGGSGAPAVQHCLALRRWYDLQPGREFRCFVVGGRLAGACQRDITQCYPFLEAERGELAAALQAFYGRQIAGRFPHPHFVFDAYVAASGAVKLLDFNPAGGTTAPLLFSWHELLPGAAAGLEPAAVQPEAQQATVGSHAAGAAAAGDGGEAAASCRGCCDGQAAGAEAQPSYLQQLRRMRALSLADQPQAGAAAGAAAEAASAGAAAASGGQELELRLVEEAAPMRPSALAYGVPFDFVDSSQGSALDRLMQQAGATGAGELWQALAAQRGGAAAGTPN